MSLPRLQCCIPFVGTSGRLKHSHWCKTNAYKYLTDEERAILRHPVGGTTESNPDASHTRAEWERCAILNCPKCAAIERHLDDADGTARVSR